MSVLSIIFRPIISFMMVASFSLFFMHFFLVAGVLTTKIQRNVIDETDEMKNLNGYMAVSMGGLIAGCVSLFVLAYL